MRIVGIEALRALAVLWVAWFHYTVVRDPQVADPWITAWRGWRPTEVLAGNGNLGVDVFFLITGFLLVMPWAGARPPTAWDFYRRRVRRIVPAYYVQLVFLFAVAAPLVLGSAYLATFGDLIALNVAAHALFLHYTTPLTSASLGVNGALWTLTLEAQFYLLLPLLAPRFVRRPFAWAIALLVVAGAWRWLAANDFDGLVAAEMALGSRFDLGERAIRPLVATQLPAFLGHFAAGMLLGLGWLRREGTAKARDAWQAPAALLLAGSVFAWTFALGGAARMGDIGAWLATLCGTSALLHAFTQGGLDRWIAPSPVRFVGRSSYSIYLYHLPLLLLWNRFRIFDGSAWSFPAWLAVVLLAGAASYALVERPFLAQARRASPL